VRVLLTGRNGQVGWELARALAPLGEVVAFDREGLDLTNPDRIVSVVRSVRPDVLVNAAAYTAVDRAESEPEVAMQVNGTAPGILGEEARRLGAVLIHYSTDYVFDGAKAGPYVESDAPNPINAYGRSKLAGELAVRASDCRHLILRTSWVYGLRGRNFLLTVLKLARERPEVRVVSDQVGAPTWCREVAVATARLVQDAGAQETRGLFHLTASGATSWCGFAEEIFRLRGIKTPVRAILTGEYPTPARRPANSSLSGAAIASRWNLALQPWQTSLSLCLREADTRVSV
jgi:dTDP-4-dehydrorhamnose reductase